MKITKQYLQKVIKEELTVALGETESLEQEGMSAAGGITAGIVGLLSTIGMANTVRNLENQKNEVEKQIVAKLEQHKDIDVFKTLQDAGISVKTLHGHENAKKELARMIVNGEIPDKMEDFPKYSKK